MEPKETTDKQIWKYLLSSNLLKDFKKIEITEIDKITVLEKATHNKNYPEADLFKIYTGSVGKFCNADDVKKIIIKGKI